MRAAFQVNLRSCSDSRVSAGVWGLLRDLGQVRGVRGAGRSCRAQNPARVRVNSSLSVSLGSLRSCGQWERSCAGPRPGEGKDVDFGLRAELAAPLRPAGMSYVFCESAVNTMSTLQQALSRVQTTLDACRKPLRRWLGICWEKQDAPCDRGISPALWDPFGPVVQFKGHLFYGSFHKYGGLKMDPKIVRLLI